MKTFCEPVPSLLEDILGVLQQVTGVFLLRLEGRQRKFAQDMWVDYVFCLDAASRIILDCVKKFSMH